MIKRVQESYRLNDGCGNCEHAFLEDDPECWNGACDFFKDRPKSPNQLGEYTDGRSSSPEWIAWCEWKFKHHIDPEGICDNYSKGKTQREIESG